MFAIVMLVLMIVLFIIACVAVYKASRRHLNVVKAMSPQEVDAALNEMEQDIEEGRINVLTNSTLMHVFFWMAVTIILAANGWAILTLFASLAYIQQVDELVHIWIKQEMYKTLHLFSTSYAETASRQYSFPFAL